MRKTQALILLFAPAFCAAAASAQLWAEVGDAGELPGSAQTTIGVGALNTITGLNDASTSDKDMFLIKILGGGGFSADLVSARLDGSGADDTKMYLFDAAGFGIMGDDDSSVGGGTFDSGLPLGHPLINTLPEGLYLLAVTDFNFIPTSAGGNIFPGGNLVGPTGPGGGSAHSGWSTDFHELSWNYTITLTGAEYAVPAPGTVALAAAGGLLIRRRR